MQQPEDKQSYLCGPPHSSSQSADAFACSPCHPHPSPCSQSNLSLKTSFLPFIFFPSSHLHQHHAACQWPGRRVMWSLHWLLPGRRKGKCVSQPIFLAQLRGQRSAQCWSSLLFLTLFLLSSLHAVYENASWKHDCIKVRINSVNLNIRTSSAARTFGVSPLWSMKKAEWSCLYEKISHD